MISYQVKIMARPDSATSRSAWGDDIRDEPALGNGGNFNRNPPRSSKSNSGSGNSCLGFLGRGVRGKRLDLISFRLV